MQYVGYGIFLKNLCGIGIITTMQYFEYWITRVLIWWKKIKDGRHDPHIFPNFLKNGCGLGINTTMQYFEYCYQVDKDLIWWKKIKVDRHDRDIFKNLLKNWCCLGIIASYRSLEHRMNWRSGFVDMRVTRYGCGHTRRRRWRTKPYKNKKASPWQGEPQLT